MNGKILVTGSAGFMGSHLVDALEREEHDVCGVDDLSGGYMRNVSNKKKFTKLDLRDRKKTAAYIERVKPEIIFHLAADATVGRSHFTPFSAVDRNFVAYMNLLVPAIRSGLKTMILTSSMDVYGEQQVPFRESTLPNPEDIYGISKQAMETSTRTMADVFGFSYVIIRPHNVYGPRQNLADPYRNVISIFINRLMQGKPFYVYGDGNQERAFSYIDDVIPPMIKAAQSPSAQRQIFNIGSDETVSLNNVAQLVLEAFFDSKPIPKKYQPLYTPDRPKEVKYAYSDHSKARELLGFESATDLRAGIRNMIVWAREVGPQKFIYLDAMDLDHPTLPRTWKQRLI